MGRPGPDLSLRPGAASQDLSVKVPWTPPGLDSITEKLPRACGEWLSAGQPEDAVAK